MRSNLVQELSSGQINGRLMSLYELWNKFDVDVGYQNIITSYLQRLPNQLRMQAIDKQIKLTYQRQSHYFQLAKLNRNRKIILLKLTGLVKQTISTQTLTIICYELAQLREVNLLITELVLQMKHLYSNGLQPDSQMENKYYWSILQVLDSDYYFVKNSELRKFICFDEAYDPFLLYHYEQLHKNRKNYNQKHNLGLAAVYQLFSISINETYRMLKAKNSAIELRSAIFTTEKQLKQITELKHKHKQGEIVHQKSNIQKNKKNTKKIHLFHPKQPRIESVNQKSDSTVYKFRSGQFQFDFDRLTNQQPAVTTLKFRKIKSKKLKNTNDQKQIQQRKDRQNIMNEVHDKYVKIPQETLQEWKVLVHSIEKNKIITQQQTSKQLQQKDTADKRKGDKSRNRLLAPLQKERINSFNSVASQRIAKQKYQRNSTQNIKSDRMPGFIKKYNNKERASYRTEPNEPSSFRYEDEGLSWDAPINTHHPNIKIYKI